MKDNTNTNNTKTKPHAYHKSRGPKIAPIIVVALLTVVIGTIFYSYIENLTILDSLYFCVMTLTTIGYGSVDIVSPAGKIFTIFYAIFGVGIIASAASYIIQRSLARHAERQAEKRHAKTNDIH